MNETTTTYFCPSNPVARFDDQNRPSGTIAGCGKTFDQSNESRTGDPDGWVDCPHCGLGFDPDNPVNRLESIRAAIHAENVSYGELAELANLVEFIDPGDVELLEWAGVPEFPEDADLRDEVRCPEWTERNADREVPDL